MNKVKLILIGLILVLSGCATPPEVKQLSVKQADYFDIAILAVSLQSDSLILATEKLVKEAKGRITDEESANRLRLENLILKGVNDQETASKISQKISKTAAEAVISRAKLDHDLSIIKRKIEELNTFINKMKEVHIALDSYIQSEKAGEVVLQDVLNHPSVNSLLNTVNELTPKIKNGVTEISTLLSGIN